MSWIISAMEGLENLAKSGIFTLIFATCVIGRLIIYALKKNEKYQLLNKVPGLKTFPPFGNALDLNVNPTELFKVITGKSCDYESSISRMWLGWTPYCLVYKARAVETILSSQKHIDKSEDYRFLHLWLGTGLLTSTGTKWHSRRKMLTPAFHFKILEDFVDVFNQQSSIFVDKLSLKADGEVFDIFPFITLCTLDIILETAMGRSINAQENSDSDYVKAVYKIGEIVQLRQTRPWLRPDLLFHFSKKKTEFVDCIKILHDFSNETIKEKRTALGNKPLTTTKDDAVEDFISIGKKKKLAFLDLLLDYSENGTILSDEDVREEVDTFMFEGHDTTAAAINWAIYLLGSHPKIQEKVYEEIFSVFGDSDRSITSADLKEMKYLECCIKETLRIFPSVPFFARELNEDVVIDGYTIPSGSTAMIVTYKLHRDPTQFPDPEEFKPERFLPENCAKRHPYAYVPFSAGPRNCIGQKFAQMEDKIVLANFFRKYRVESTVKREDLKILGELILRPEAGNSVKIFRRT